MHYNINITIINVYITINNIFTAEYFDYIHIPLVFGLKAGPRIFWTFFHKRFLLSNVLLYLAFKKVNLISSLIYAILVCNYSRF